MRKWEITETAVNDLEEIFSHSIEKWGENKTYSYMQSIEKGFDMLAAFPNIGRTKERVIVKSRSFKIEDHIIFYLTDPGKIVILRVLHTKMNHSKHLKLYY